MLQACVFCIVLLSSHMQSCQCTTQGVLFFNWFITELMLISPETDWPKVTNASLPNEEQEGLPTQGLVT